jgi:hypothetical protein
MTRTNPRALPKLASAVVWVALGFAVSGCVAKPAFRCQSDASCVSADGSRGSCEPSGECSFHAALGDAGGSSGSGGAAGARVPTVSTAGMTSSVGAASGDGGHGGSAGEVDAAGEIDAAGAAGASCTDEAAGSCYSCSPKTPAQFLNACTSATCVPFDDHTRLTNLTSSGALPPLPPASGQ